MPKEVIADDTLVIRVPGDLSSTTVAVVRKMAQEAMERSPAGLSWHTLVLDISQARMLDSAGLHLIVTLLRNAQMVKARMQVVYGNPNVLRVLQFTRLDAELELVQASA